MSRSVPEWIADHDDQDIPKRVKLRIWEREEGRCSLTGKKIRPGDSYEFEHVIALQTGGEHREGNIRLALNDAHKVKTADDAKAGAKVRRIAAKHAGIWPKGQPIKSRGFDDRLRARREEVV